MVKILKADLDKLIHDGQEYEIQEVKDLVAQLEKEKLEQEKNMDSGDFIIFHGKEFRVKRANYGAIRRYTQNQFFRLSQKQSDKFISVINKLKEYIDSFKVGKKKTFKERIVFFFYWLKMMAFSMPFVLKRFEQKNFKAMSIEWRKLVANTFDGDLKEMELENITTEEVGRLTRIFFRWQAGAVQEKQEKP